MTILGNAKRTAAIRTGGVALLFQTDTPEAVDYLEEVGMFGASDFSVNDDAPDVKVDGLLEYIGGRDEPPAVAFESSSPMMLVTAPWRKIRGSTMLRLAILRIAEFVRQSHGEFLLHASAVEKDGRAIVLVGDSESGKTSLALNLCLNYGCRFLSNDQTRLALSSGQSFLVAGDSTFNFRAGSLDRVYKELATRIFEYSGQMPIDFHEKRRVAAEDLGVETGSPPVRIGLMALIRVDAGREGVTIERHGTEATTSLFTVRREMFCHMSSLLRGSDIVPLDENLKFYVDLFLPNIDTPALCSRRLSIVEELLMSGRFIRASGPLELLSQALVEAELRASEVLSGRDPLIG